MKATLLVGNTYSVKGINTKFKIGVASDVSESEVKILAGIERDGQKLFRIHNGEAIDNTDSMSRDEIKAALTGRGISFNPNANTNTLAALLKKSSVEDIRV